MSTNGHAMQAPTPKVSTQGVCAETIVSLCERRNLKLQDCAYADERVAAPRRALAARAVDVVAVGAALACLVLLWPLAKLAGAFSVDEAS